jgi:hypothetical protein
MQTGVAILRRAGTGTVSNIAGDVRGVAAVSKLFSEFRLRIDRQSVLGISGEQAGNLAEIFADAAETMARSL